jgi:Ferric reductase like transmembrane component
VGCLNSLREKLIWLVLAVVIAVPLGFAVTSPLLAWRDPIYIGAGIAGVVAMALLLVQPLLAGGYLPLDALRGRRMHRVVGAALVGAVLLHVAGLWITSPPDVVDALLFQSPTPFSVWGVVAMWAVFATAVLAMLRRRLKLRPLTWRRGHLVLGVVIVGCSGLHAWLIEGTMEPVSKAVLCAVAMVVTVWTVVGVVREKTKR